MNLPITKKQLIQLMRNREAEGRLCSGRGWAFDDGDLSAPFFRGCAAGNLIEAVSVGKADAIRVEKAVIKIVRNVEDPTRSVTDTLLMHRALSNRHYISALSCAFEGTSTFESFIAAVEDHFPVRFTIDLDGAFKKIDLAKFRRECAPKKAKKAVRK